MLRLLLNPSIRVSLMLIQNTCTCTISVQKQARIGNIIKPSGRVWKHCGNSERGIHYLEWSRSDQLQLLDHHVNRHREQVFAWTIWLIRFWKSVCRAQILRQFSAHVIGHFETINVLWKLATMQNNYNVNNESQNEIRNGHVTNCMMKRLWNPTVIHQNNTDQYPK